MLCVLLSWLVNRDSFYFNLETSHPEPLPSLATLWLWSRLQSPAGRAQSPKPPTGTAYRRTLLGRTVDFQAHKNPYENSSIPERSYEHRTEMPQSGEEPKAMEAA